MTTNKKKATNYYTTAVSDAIKLQVASLTCQNVKNRNRERKAPRVSGKKGQAERTRK